ncbi:MAG: helix-turn-helix transcriptional regulator [Deltaproteobacteria bacterium]|nr:helix-turn-helix transcriptional regulator [Deltaproteobacteria bacterium]
MAKPVNRNYSRTARDASALLGAMIRAARLHRRMSTQELAERAGASRSLVVRVEAGDMGSGIGAAFEMAAVLGVPLFDADPGLVNGRLAKQREVNSLLPRRAFPTSVKVDDDF